MSTVDPTRAQQGSSAGVHAPGGQTRDYVDETAGEGWVLFAATMLGLLGIMNLIQGIAAVSTSSFFVDDAQFILSGLNTWGWILIVLGAAQAVLAVGISMRVPSLRWFGVLIAGLNAIAQLGFIDAYPFFSLALFTLDILVIYGLVAHGAKPAARRG